MTWPTSLKNLKQDYLSCTKCPSLCRSRTKVVFGEGSPKAEILFVGEAPGANEDREGIPFCGASGKILDELLQSINLSREEIFISNIILCRPENNRNPAKEEVENCRERLDALISIIQPKVIVTIGNFSTERIIGRTGVKSIRGKTFLTTINGRSITVIPVIHPASYLYSGRDPELFQQMRADFQTVSALVSGSKKQTTLSEF